HEQSADLVDGHRRDGQDAVWDALRHELRQRVALSRGLAGVGAIHHGGNRYLCPFHGETRPSFWTFSGDDGAERWVCAHGGAPVGHTTRSGYASGDVVDLYAYHRDMPVGKATAAMAQRLGLALPNDQAQGLSEGAPQAAGGPTFPLGALPHPFRPFVEQAAASIVMPADYAALPLLTAAGTAIGNA